MPPALVRGVAPVRTLVPGGVRIFCAASKSRSLRLVHRQNMSFRTSAHAGVGIPIEFQAAYRHTDRSFTTFSGIYPREVVRLSGGLPRQCAHWCGNLPVLDIFRTFCGRKLWLLNSYLFCNGTYLCVQKENTAYRNAVLSFTFYRAAAVIGLDAGAEDFGG